MGPMSPGPEHLFTKAEADSLLPRLRDLLARLRELATSESTREGRQHLARTGRSNGSPAAAQAAFQAAAGVRSLLDEVDEMGVILRDADSGLCDFPGEREGRPIYLCWRLAEEEVAWWHPRDTGIAGRQPL